MHPTYDIALFGMISRHPGKNRGGVSVSVRRLANALADTGTRVAIITSQAACTERWRNSLHEAITVFPQTRLSRLQLTVSLIAFIVSHRPTSLIAFDQRAGLIAARALCIPSVNTRLFWSPRVAVSEQSRQASARTRQRRIREIQAIHRRSTGFIAISHGLAKDLSAFADIPSGAITTIHNPVIDAEFRRSAHAKRPAEPTLPASRALIVSTGRLVEQKNYASLIRAFKRVNERIPAFLLILGEGPERATLEALIEEQELAPYVSLPGYVPNPLPYMRQANVFALSSRDEGFGNVLAEALALGTAVVSTDCPFGPAEILDNGRYGILTPVGDAHALADALITTLGHPPDPAHQRAGAARFDSHRVAQQYHDAVFGSTSQPA